MNRRRLIWQLYSSYALIAVAALALTAVYFSVSARNEYLRNQNRDILVRLRLFEETLGPRISETQGGSVDSLCERLGAISGTRVRIILPSGVVIGDNERGIEHQPSVKTRPEVIAAFNGKTGKAVRYSAREKTDMIFVAGPLYGKTERDSVIVGALQLSEPIEVRGAFIARTYVAVAIGALFAIVLSAIVGYVISRRLTQPLEALADWALNRRDSDSAIPFSHHPVDEITKLYRALNESRTELDNKVADALRQKNEQAAILASMSEGIFALDLQERIICANGAACDWFSIGTRDITGLTIQETARNSDLERIVRSALQNQTGEQVAEELTLPNGRILQAHAVALCDEANNRLGVVVALHDITRVRKLESVRREFVANVSHELKTPITSIKGYIETLLLENEQLTEHQRKFLEIASGQSDRLQAIIDDLLTLSRLERESDIELEVIEVKELLSSARRLCQERANQKDIQISEKAPDGLTLLGRARLLEQALINLLDNAILYSEPQTTVTLEAEEEEGEILLRVRDQGGGIEEEHLPRLFERFYRIDKARNRKTGGSGLGLAIVKHIALVHRGQVDVTSVPGRGSVFTLCLPKAPRLSRKSGESPGGSS